MAKIVIIALLICFNMILVDSFIFTSKSFDSVQNSRVFNVLKQSLKSGGHGDGFKYIPIHQAKELEHFPRIVPIAGVYPELTPQDLMAPCPSLPFRKGTWTYDFSTPDDTQLGTVALPPSDIMTASIDPVAVISTNIALGITNMLVDVEVVVVIDRGNKVFKSGDFFAFKSPNNEIIIRWSDKVPPGHEVLGKIVLCTIPWVQGMKKRSSGFLEDDEDETE